MWKYIGKQMIRHGLNGTAAILTVCLLFYLLSGGEQWTLGEGALIVFVCR